MLPLGPFLPLMPIGGAGPTPPPPAYLPADFDALAFLDGSQPSLLHILRMCLFSNARASDDDALPGTDRGGWWADTYAAGYPVGSKLWLLDRAIVTQDAINRAQDYSQTALAFLVRYGIASAVAVTAERIASDNSAAGIGLVVTVTRPNGTRETFRFADIWAELGGASG